jgi:hypothetical protein
MVDRDAEILGSRPALPTEVLQIGIGIPPGITRFDNPPPSAALEPVDRVFTPNGGLVSALRGRWFSGASRLDPLSDP